MTSVKDLGKEQLRFFLHCWYFFFSFCLMNSSQHAFIDNYSYFFFTIFFLRFLLKKNGCVFLIFDMRFCLVPLLSMSIRGFITRSSDMWRIYCNVKHSLILDKVCPLRCLGRYFMVAAFAFVTIVISWAQFTIYEMTLT